MATAITQAVAQPNSPADLLGPMSEGSMCLGYVVKRNPAMTVGIVWLEGSPAGASLRMLMAPQTIDRIRYTIERSQWNGFQIVDTLRKETEIQRHTTQTRRVNIVHLLAELPDNNKRRVARLDRLDALRERLQQMSVDIVSALQPSDIELDEELLLEFARARQGLLTEFASIENALLDTRGQLEVVDELLHQMGGRL